MFDEAIACNLRSFNTLSSAILKCTIQAIVKGSMEPSCVILEQHIRAIMEIFHDIIMFKSRTKIHQETIVPYINAIMCHVD